MTINLQWSPDKVARLRTVLAELYASEADARRFVTDLSWSPSQIEFHPKIINTWYAILQHARNRSGLDAVLHHALMEFPENDQLRTLERGGVLTDREGIEPSDWRGKGQPALEALMGRVSSLVPIAFLELGLERAKAVARVVFPDGSSGTGFLITNNILVTNCHVIRDQDEAGLARAQFNYQLTLDGTIAPVLEYQFDPARFFRASSNDDWTAVALAGDAAIRCGAIDLQNTRVSVGDRVNIIQHPGGSYKQIAYFSNIVAFVGEGRVQYLTDTLPGSSGSPVFDRNWNVVALHHSGGWHTEPGGSIVHYRNEGIAVERIIEGLR